MNPSGARAATAMQRAMLLASIKGGKPPAYHLQQVLELDASIDVAILREAWRRVVARHDGLRARFAFEGAAVLQHVGDAAVFPWRELDGGDVGAEVRKEFEAPFYLSGDSSPWRVLVASKAGGGWVWSLAIHHAVADAHACGLLLSELFATYRCLEKGEEPRDGGKVGNFLDYLDWHAGKSWTEAEEFWRGQFRDVSGPTPIATMHGVGRSSAHPDETRRVAVEVGGGLDAALRELAADLDVTMNTFVLAAWALWLARTGDESRVAFGAVRACRKSSVPDAERIVGSFANTLPLRVDVSERATVREWLREVRGAWTALRDVEHSPLDLVHRWSGFAEGTPLFESLVNFQRMDDAEAFRRLGFEHARMIASRRSADTPLALAAYELPTLRMEVVHKPAAVSDTYAAQAARSLSTILRQFVECPDRPLSEVSLLSEAETARILAHAEGPRVPIRDEDNAWARFEAAATRNPGAVAMELGERAWTRAEVRDGALAVARALAARGIGRGAIVGVALPPSPAMAILLLGIVRAGAALYPLGPDMPPERRRRIFADAKVACIFAGMPTEFDDVPTLRVDERLGGSDAHEEEDADAELARFAWYPRDLAYLVHTSGSTGEAKSIQIEHRSFASILRTLAALYELNDGDRRIQRAQPGTDFFIAEVFVNLTAGATLVFSESPEALGIAEFLDVLERRRITVTGMPSSYWHEWVRLLVEKDAAALPSSLRLAIAGMEKVDVEALRKWRRVVGDRVKLLNVYGPAETAMVATAFRCDGGLAPGAAHVPIGAPLANTRAYVLDRELRLRPPGMAGEIHVAGAGLMRGYVGVDADAFVANPHSNEADFDRLYPTGDIGFVQEDGNIVFLGRRDNQVKIRGHRIELESVEAMLSEILGGRPAAAIAVDVGAQRVLHAFAETEGLFDELEIKAAMRRRAHSAMVPSRIESMAALPRLSNGKIDRVRLRESVAATAEADEAFDATALAGDAEARIVAVFRHILRRPELSADDDFFRCGGDSLGAIRAIAQIELAIGWQPPLRDVYAAPTARGLARLFGAGSRRGAVHLVPADGDADVSADLHLIVVPPATGVLRRFELLRRHWCGRAKLWALEQEPPSPDADLYPIPYLAANYARRIEEAFAGRSVALLGYSSGGPIAWEVATLLRGSKVAVRDLVLLEPTTVVDLPDGSRKLLKPVYRGAGAMGEAATYWRHAGVLGFAERAAFVRDVLLRRARRVAGRRGGAADFDRPYLMLYQAAICGAYRPAAYAGRVHLVRGHARIAHGDCARHDAAWSSLAADFHLHATVGNHLRLLAEPEVRVTAARIAAILGQ